MISSPPFRQRKIIGKIITAALFVAVLFILIAAKIHFTESIGSHRLDNDVTLSSPNSRRQLQMLEKFGLSQHTAHLNFEIYNGETGETLLSLGDENEANPLNNLVDSRAPRNAHGRETAFFFHIRKSKGGAVKNIMTHCFNLRRAEKKTSPESLTFVDGVLNIDTQTLAGLKKAQETNLVDSGLVDVIVSSYFFEGMMLFNPTHQGRAFTFLPHPVYQTESLYRSLKKRYPDSFRRTDISEWVQSDAFTDNWVVRSLINQHSGELTEDHLVVAKIILAQKFVVGISQYPKETLKRLVMYYGWNEVNGKGFECMNHFLNLENDEDVQFEGKIERGSERWKLLSTVNKYDMDLYYYSLQLFAKQGSTLFGRPYVDKDGVPIDFAKLKAQKDKEKLEAFLNSFHAGDE
mmetsp:Transcript_11004/g.16558  ORF Transcript_11004/g.16558 Transcript_11004/m.16558 type:complete len:405 (-) Transcript_11004:129-1343(-)